MPVRTTASSQQKSAGVDPMSVVHVRQNERLVPLEAANSFSRARNAQPAQDRTTNANGELSTQGERLLSSARFEGGRVEHSELISALTALADCTGLATQGGYNPDESEALFRSQPHLQASVCPSHGWRARDGSMVTPLKHPRQLTPVSKARRTSLNVGRSQPMRG